MAQLSYKAGKLLAQNPSIITFALACIVGGTIFSLMGGNPPKPATLKPAPSCAEQKPTLLAAHRKHLQDGHPWAAATALRPCATSTGDRELIDLMTAAELADRIQTAHDAKAPATHRVLAIEQIEHMAPAQGADLQKLKHQLTKEIEREAAASRKAEAAYKKSQGVQLGMSAQDVLASSWGKPRRINRSVYSFGVHEQWVYHGSNYLYFKDGKLDSVQTGE